VISKKPARKKADNADKDVADERAPKGRAQGELDAANQSAQQKQQDHTNDDGDGSITNKHSESRQALAAGCGIASRVSPAEISAGMGVMFFQSFGGTMPNHSVA